jgi:hypothetical protein
MSDETKTPWPKEIDGKINLHGHTDAVVWAKEFCRLYPQAMAQTPGKEGLVHDGEWEDIMVGWFANAIMTGVDHANWANGVAPNCSLPWDELEKEN